jgi:transposase
MLCDALGRPLRFILSGGQQNDCKSAEQLLQGHKTAAVVADKGYDTNAVRAFIQAAQMRAVIPSKANRRPQFPFDRELYKQRNLIERCFGTIKQNRRIATRYDRNDSHFMGFLFLAAANLWL